MALNNLSKELVPNVSEILEKQWFIRWVPTVFLFLRTYRQVNILILLVISTQEQAKAATNYLIDNTVGAREPSQQSLYTEIPQQYYVPYQKYIPTSNGKYVAARPEVQIPVAVSSTEKTLVSPTYKVTLDTSKYVTSQAAKPTLGNHVSYPYVYTLAKVVPSTVETLTSASSVGNNYNDYSKEEPKKYQYGYRVSNPNTGTEFGHSEVNDGHSAKGYYHVLLPDGRLQNVKYWAGPSGYHATITYETQY